MANPQISPQSSNQPQNQQPEKTVTVVINNREALELVQLPHRGSDKHGRPMLGELLRLTAGVNLVDSTTLATLMKNELFAAKFTTKIARSPAPEQNPERVGRTVLELGPVLPASRSFAKLDGEQAQKLIEETLDTDLLEKWRSEDTRDGMRLGLQKRIDALIVTSDQGDG
jgi:hypothetical protein